MFTKFQILTTIALVHLYALQPSVGSDINTALHHINNGQLIEQQSSDIDEIVKAAYNNSFDNFYKVIEFTYFTSNMNLKADIISALYNEMDAANHTEDPLQALPLYNEIENVININDGSMTSGRLKELETFRRTLLLEKIVVTSPEILLGAVYLNSCNHAKTSVGQLFDLINASNFTVSELVMHRVVRMIRWTLPSTKKVTILADLSVHVRINVDAMLALYNEEQVEDEVSMDFYMNLGRLRQHPQYNVSVSEVKQNQVDAVLPTPLQILFGGYACLHQKMSNGSIFYLRNCSSSYRACINISQEIEQRDVFAVEVHKQLQALNFRANNSLPLSISSSTSIESGGYRLNIYVDTYSERDWKVNLKGNEIILSNMKETMFLCAGNSKAMGSYNDWFAYSRDPDYYVQYQNECKWTVDDCSNI